MGENASSAGNQQETRSSKRGSSETIRQTPTTKSEIIAYLNGALHDASLNKRKRIRFTQKNRQWLEKLQSLLQRIECNSWIYKEGKNRNVFVLETLCKDLDFAFNPTKLRTKNEKVCFIRGFFYAEGGIPHTTDRFYIQLVQKDYLKIKRLRNLLREIDIETGIIHNPSKKKDPNYWRVFVSTRCHKRFAEIVGSYHPVKIKILRGRMKI